MRKRPMVSLITLIVVLGIFSIFAFIAVGVMLRHYQLEMGPWLVLSLVTLCLTLGFFMTYSVENHWMATRFFLIAFSLLSVLAGVQFWSIMRLTQ